MRGTSNLTALLVLASHATGAFLLSIWNDFFAFGPIYFYLGGIFAVLPVIRLDFGRGFFCAVVSGCFLDATLPTPFGFHACALAIAHIVLHLTNEQKTLRRRPTLILGAVIINPVIFFALHLWFSVQIPDGSNILHGRAVVDLLFSELLLVVALPWLIDLHDAYLSLVGLEPSDAPSSA
ncbi:MAG: hypothetical protein CMI32_05955 [Opitutales bacterium]|nr:hypothetical protein [Opitutales bacterium]